MWAAIGDDVKHLKEDRRGPGRAIDESQERMLFDVARSKPQWAAAFYAAHGRSNTTAPAWSSKTYAWRTSTS